MAEPEVLVTNDGGMESTGFYALDIDREWCVPFLPAARAAPAGIVRVLEALDVDTFAVLRSSSGYARGATGGLESFLADSGIDVVATETYQRGDPQARAAALERAAAADPDAMGPGGAIPEVRALVRAIDDRGVTADTFAWLDFDDSRVMPLVDIAEGMIGLGVWTARAPFDGNEAFVDGFLEWASVRRPDWTRSRLLRHHPAAAYAGAEITARAVENAGEFDNAAVRDELWDLETGTIQGTYAVDDDGYQVGKEMLVLQIQRRLREVVWPPELRTAAPRLPTLERPGGT